MWSLQLCEYYVARSRTLYSDKGLVCWQCATGAIPDGTNLQDDCEEKILCWNIAPRVNPHTQLLTDSLGPALLHCLTEAPVFAAMWRSGEG